MRIYIDDHAETFFAHIKVSFFLSFLLFCLICVIYKLAKALASLPAG